ncbi:MAG: hypothetical protein ACD_73C00601G0001, partial [uncultured bacterium]
IRPNLLNEMNKACDFEQKLDALRLFKKTEFDKIAGNDKGNLVRRSEILKQLSLIAEITVQEALILAASELTPRFGHPQHEISSNQKDNTHFVALGMGKFGGFEINYYSDLDMIFIYSHNGETTGPKIISNAEYYAKLVQKFISILSVPTRYGVAFEIDTELRPSGNKGTLVTTLESFLEYQNTVSQVWERQALIRARPVAGSAYLARIINEHIDSLLYSRNMPKSIKKEMNQLRGRVIKEIAKENRQYIDIKLGRGALMDIEFILQFFQLSQASSLPTLKQKNTSLGLDKLAGTHLLKDNMDVIILKEIYQFYRSLESLISLKAKRRIHRLKYDSPLLYEAALEMGYPDFEQFKSVLMSYKHKIRDIYRKVFNLKKRTS